MRRAIRPPLLAALLLAFGSAGCDKPAAISAFCASASGTLTAAAPVFEDMQQSCLREVASRSDFATFELPWQDDANCREIGEKAEGAVAAAKILADYFTAINALATYGTTQIGSDANTLATKASAAMSANSSAQTAIGSLASFLVSAAASGYQQRKLAEDLPAAAKHVSAVTGALETIVRDDYIGRLLDDEEKKVRVRYREALREASSAGKPSVEARLILDARWTAEEQALLARRESAKDLVAALEALDKGSQDLASHAKRLDAKEVPSLLSPYVAQLNTLIPEIQKAF